VFVSVDDIVIVFPLCVTVVAPPPLNLITSPFVTDSLEPLPEVSYCHE